MATSSSECFNQGSGAITALASVCPCCSKPYNDPSTTGSQSGTATTNTTTTSSAPHEEPTETPTEKKKVTPEAQTNKTRQYLPNEVLSARFPFQGPPEGESSQQQHTTPTLIPALGCVVLPQPGSRFCEHHGIPLTILCWGPNPPTSKTLPPPTPHASNSSQKSAATKIDHHPKIICTECLFSGEHVGHTNHENLAVAEKRLRGSLEGVIEILTQRCANALNMKCNAEAQLSALQRQLNDCDNGMEIEVQQLVKSILEVLKGCQIKLRKLVTTKSQSLENVVTQSRNQFYVLSNNIVLGKRLCSLEGIKVGETTSSSFGPSSVKRPPILDNNTSSFAFVNVFLQLQPTLQKAFVESSTQATSEHNDANVAPEIKEVMDTIHEITREKPGEVKDLRAKCAHLQKAVARLGTLAVGELLFDTPGDEHKVWLCRQE
ncbi:hypothetical protein Pelo_1263 [Pelomyxa schiedti]|nr:hypothetical protein Pelo_1263 [Pelomyxa schiedti]